MSTTRMFSGALAALSVGVVFTACGIGDGGLSLPAERPTGRISGNAVDALVRNGAVAVYGFSGGRKAELLGTGVTDDEGGYSIDVRSVDQPILIEVTGGHYFEEASGTRVDLKAGQRLTALTHYVSGEPVTAMVTPATHWAAALARYRIGQGTGVSNAITEASTAISTLLGVDILNTYPANITDDAFAGAALNDSLSYGFLAAAVSSWSADISGQNGVPVHTTYTSIGISQLIYEDLHSDGHLDGAAYREGQQVSLHAGLVGLGEDAFRREVSRHLLLAAADPGINRTAVRPADLLGQAQRIAGSEHAVFAGAAPGPLDVDPPVVEALFATENYHSGVIELPIALEDLTGVASIGFDLDGQHLAVIDGSEEPTLVLDTADWSDGAHLLGVYATDNVGNEHYVQFPLSIDNSAPGLTITSPAATNKIDFVLEGQVSDGGSGLSSIEVNGTQVQPQADGSWRFPVSLNPGVNDFTIVLTDLLGNQTVAAASVSVDTAAPMVTSEFSQVDYLGTGGSSYRASLAEASGEHDPVKLEWKQIFLAGIPIERLALDDAGIPWLHFELQDASTGAVTSDPQELTLEFKLSIGGTVRSDWRAVMPYHTSDVHARYLVPIATEFFGTDWYSGTGANDQVVLDFRAYDAVGNRTEWRTSFLAAFDLQDILVVSPVSRGDATLYSYANGQKGGVIGSCTTNATGNCRIATVTDPQPILVELVGGDYMESADGRTVPLTEGQRLVSVSRFPGDDHLIAVNPLTTAGAAGVIHAIASSNSTVDEALSAAIEHSRAQYGIDIYHTAPVDISNVANASAQLTDGQRYGFLLAAVSGLSLDLAIANGSTHDIFSTVLLTEKWFEDVLADGIADGYGSAGALSVGTLGLSAETYRHELALNLVEVANGDLNAIHVPLAEMVNYARLVNDSVAAAYGTSEPLALDDAPPVLMLSRPDGSWFGGESLYDVTATDFTGIAAVAFSLDGTPLGTAADPQAPSIVMDTTGYSDGAHVLAIEAMDNVGNVAVISTTVRFDNTAPSYTLRSGALYNASPAQLSGDMADLLSDGGPGSGVETLTVAGVNAELDVASGTWSAPASLLDGANPLEVVVTDAVGNSVTSTILASLDKGAPVADFSGSSNASFWNGSGTYVEPILNATADGYPIRVFTDHAGLNGTDYTDPDAMNAAGYPWFEFQVSDPIYSGVQSAADELSVSMRYSHGSTVKRDWQRLVSPVAPGNRYLVPLASEFLGTGWFDTPATTSHKLELAVSDEAGNTTSYTYRFRVAAFVPKPSPTVTDLDFLSNTVFERRMDLAGKTHPATSYRWVNDTGKDYYFLPVKDEGLHEWVNTVQWAEREHKYFTRSWNSYRSNSASYTSVIDLSLPLMSFVESACSIAANESFVTRSSIVDWVNGAESVLELPLNTADTGFVNLESDVLPAAQTPSPWSSYSYSLESSGKALPPEYMLITKPSQGAGTYAVPAFDAWTFYNSPPPYPDITEGYNWPNKVERYYSRFYIDGRDSSWGVSDSLVIRQVVNRETWTGIDGSAVLNGYQVDSAQVCSKTVSLSVQQRTNYSNYSVPGFPRNNSGYETKTTALPSSGFTVYVDGANAASTDGWYKVPAGSVVELVKKVDFPELALGSNYYNDLDVANLASFASYDRRYYDQSWTWSIGRTATFRFTHGWSYATAGSHPESEFGFGSGAAVHTLAR